MVAQIIIRQKLTIGRRLTGVGTGVSYSARSLAPGVLIIIGIAFLSQVLAKEVSHIPPVVIALALGMVIANTVDLSAVPVKAAAFTSHWLLRAAIILLGANLSLRALAEVWGISFLVVFLCIAFALLVGLITSKVVKLPGKVGPLLAAGVAICGSTAILVCGPLIKAKEREIGLAIITIFLFNLLAVLLYPVIGHSLGLLDTSYGIWAGTSINDTSSVLAAGAAFDDQALATATVVKLTRTLFLVPLAMLFAATMLSQGQSTKGIRKGVVSAVPWFLGGFLLLVLLNTANLIGNDVQKLSGDVAGFLVIMVTAAVGLKVRLPDLLAFGFKPLVLGVAIGCALSGFSLFLIYVITPG